MFLAPNNIPSKGTFYQYVSGARTNCALHGAKSLIIGRHNSFQRLSCAGALAPLLLFAPVSFQRGHVMSCFCNVMGALNVHGAQHIFSKGTFYQFVSGARKNCAPNGAKSNNLGRNSFERHLCWCNECCWRP